MLKIRRIMALLLSLLAFSVHATAESPKTFTMMGLEAEDTDRKWSENLFFERMGEKTGVWFEFRQYTEDVAAYQTAKEQAFSSGDLPDVFFKAYLTPQEEMNYLASGQLVDLAPYLEEHAPNFYAILEARPDWRAVITQPNGAITSLPILNGADRQCVIWINQTWLETLGLEMPATIEDYTEVLRAIRDGDPNGNGRKDEIPLSIVGPWEAKYLLHAFGIVANDYNIYLDDAGMVQFAPFDAAYREFAEWLNLAQNESLIDADSFRTSHSGRTAMQSTETDAPLVYGGLVSSAPYTLIDMNKTTEYAALRPLARNGEQVYRKLLNGVGRGTFAVTSACTDIPAVLRWVDELYTEEGGRLAFAGLEVEEYTIKSEGTWAWNANSDYMWLTDLVNKSLIAGDTVTPGLEPAAFMRNSEITADNYARRQVDSIREFMVEPAPVTWPTDEARENRIAELQATLGACVDTAIANFAMGKVELTDENWQAFHDELRELGAEEFISLWQAKYDEMK